MSGKEPKRVPLQDTPIAVPASDRRRDERVGLPPSFRLDGLGDLQWETDFDSDGGKALIITSSLGRGTPSTSSISMHVSLLTLTCNSPAVAASPIFSKSLLAPPLEA